MSADLHSTSESAKVGLMETASVPSSMQLRWTILQRLGSVEIRRRLWHISPGFLPFILWAVPHADPLSPTLRVIIILFALLMGGRILLHFQMIRRKGEQQRDGDFSVLGYSLSVLLMLFLFPAHAEMGFAVLAILAFGDGFATLGGLLFRGPVLPWNQQKTWAGFLCFFIIGIPMTALIYWGETHNLEAQTVGVTFLMALQCVTPAVLLSAIAESVRSHINDNIRVGAVASLLMIVMHGLMAGL